MFCSNCGTQIPDEANFCWKCGKPQKKDFEPSHQVQLEYCEVMWYEISASFTGNNKGYFYAEAINPHGKYTTRETKAFNLGLGGHLPSADRQGTIHKEFVDQLLQDGWQATGDRGEAWWALRFKRQVEEKSLTVILEPHAKADWVSINSRAVVQSLTGLDVYESQKLVKKGGVILKDVNKAIAYGAKARLEVAGGVVRLEKSRSKSKTS